MKIAILGPTASGKSGLAAELARRIGGTVVNGDPFQAFRGLEIGTGQPGPEERARAPHLGYGCLPLGAGQNPAGFGRLVREWLAQADPAVLVTGSGLYLRGIWEQLDELPEVPPPLQARVRRWGRDLGPGTLHRYLNAVDPLRAAELHPRDHSRLQRALALHLATGRRFGDLTAGVRRGIPQGWRALLVEPRREARRERIRLRVRGQILAGWPLEAFRLVEQGLEGALRELRPLGYLDWLQGGTPEAVEARIVAATQAYAKRQDTFFRNQWPELPRWDPDGETIEEAFARLGI
ncbi:MAG: tRNA (adenosine(37)-N6)-dimethylallyltransferase MiaA [Acidobacteria bacterium]|nr:tRNA (adenosine(37)-N6)-dimethylallyltransferase MiaA [Acidobacteriota bacterium]